MANISDLKVGDKVWVDWSGWEKATVVDIQDGEAMVKVSGFSSAFLSLTGRKWFKRNEPEITFGKIHIEPWHILVPVAIVIVLIALIAL